MIADNIENSFSHFLVLLIITFSHDFKLKRIYITEANSHAWAKCANNSQYKGKETSPPEISIFWWKIMMLTMLAIFIINLTLLHLIVLLVEVLVKE